MLSFGTRPPSGHGPWFPGTSALRDCQRLHGWAMQPEGQLELWQALHRVPDTSGACISMPVVERLDLFVDGSCAWPQSRHLRVASWAVVVARHFPGEEIRVLNAGCLPDIMQTSFRAEIFALYVACKFCRGAGARARVWCDCLGVVRKANMLLGGHWRVKPNTKNCDLWRLVAEELAELAGRVEVHQVRAHTTVGEETDVVQEWAQMNNQDVDQGIFGVPYNGTWRISSLLVGPCYAYMLPLAWLLPGGRKSSQWRMLGVLTLCLSRQSNWERWMSAVRRRSLDDTEVACCQPFPGTGPRCTTEMGFSVPVDV